MNTANILINQTAVMFILAAVGVLLYKGGKVTAKESKVIGNILIYVVLPCVIVNGFLVEKTTESMIILGLSALFAFIVIVIGIIISTLIFKKDPIAIFACSFSNPGFFGVPLIVAAQDSKAVFFITAFIAYVNIFQWTYGVYVLTKKKEMISLKGIVKAPFFIAICIGLILFFTGAELPAIITKTITTITAVNTPLAMFTVGIYLAQTNVLNIFKRKENYFIALIRLVVLPLISLILLKMLPGDYSMKQAILIAASCPTGSNIAVYADLHNKDYQYAVETVIMTTLFSIITIPLIVSLL